MPRPRQLFTLPPEIDQVIGELLHEGVRDQAEIERRIRGAIAQYNELPQLDLGDLSPNQVNTLLLTDWQSPGSPLRLNPSLTLEELDGADYFHNARVMLATLAEEPLGVTATGNLNRRAVALLLERFRLDPHEREELHRYNKVLNEFDVDVINSLREDLMRLKLIVRRKGFRIARQGRELLADKQAGELYRRLFLTHVLQPRYFPSRLSDPEEVVAGLPIFCWRLSRAQSEWLTTPRLAELFWPGIEELLGREGPLSDAEVLLWNASQFAFRPFQEMGLLEERVEAQKDRWRIETVAYRKTPLFKRAIEFNLA